MASRLVPLLALVAAAAGCASSGSADGEASGAARAATLPVADTGAGRVWAVGDSAGGANAAEVARLVKTGWPRKVLYLGDIYRGDKGFAAYRRLYGSLPVARTPGNHDWPKYWSGPEWYSFRVGRWQVIELNSETRRRGEQLAWLRRQLRARGTCRIAFWHRARYTVGPHGDTAYMDPYWRALKGHARLVISAHDHDMERFRPRGGLIQLVSGAGGESHYPLRRAKPGLVFGDQSHWGALRLDLSTGRARLAFVATGGRVLDASTATCRT